MTPAEWLRNIPPNEALVHEVGHTLTGLALGIREHGIGFLNPESGDVARSHYSKQGLTSKVQLPKCWLACKAKAGCARTGLLGENKH